MATTRMTGKLRQATGTDQSRTLPNLEVTVAKVKGNKGSFICASMTSDISWRHSSFKRPSESNSLKTEFFIVIVKSDLKLQGQN
jgi:hypothetical protein